MQLDANGFWARAYHACRLLWFGFYPRGATRWNVTDLCTFIRTIFVLAPLVVLLNVAAIGFAIYSILFFVTMLWINLTTVGIILAILAGGCILVATIYGIFSGGEAITRAAKHSETLKIAVEYAKARKAAICPIVTIKENANASV